LLTIMKLRSRDLTKHEEKEQSGTNETRQVSDSGISTGVQEKGSGPLSSDNSTSSRGRRASPTKRQVAEESSSSVSSSCSNNEHCSNNKYALSHRENATLHDSTNGQVVGNAGNSLPTSSASSARNQQRQKLLYGYFYHSRICAYLSTQFADRLTLGQSSCDCSNCGLVN